MIEALWRGGICESTHLIVVEQSEAEAALYISRRLQSIGFVGNCRDAMIPDYWRDPPDPNSGRA
jgi:hypothetical protein